MSAAQNDEQPANASIRCQVQANFSGTIVTATGAKVYVLYESDYAHGSFTHEWTDYTAGGHFRNTYNNLIAHDKELQALRKSKGKADDQQAIAIADRVLSDEDAALADLNKWVARHPNDAWQAVIVAPDEQGRWEADGLHPGSYRIVIRGTVSKLDADWEYIRDVEPGKSLALVPMQPKFFRPNNTVAADASGQTMGTGGAASAQPASGIGNTEPAAAQTQTASKPEDGFFSGETYVNTFFGITLPLPQDAELRPLAKSGEARETFRHTLFGANSTRKGYPAILVLADEISKSGNADPRKAVAALGAHDIGAVQINGREFLRGRWKADRIYGVAYATALKGFMLYVSTLSYDKKVLDEFENSIQQMTFFDPTKTHNTEEPRNQPSTASPPSAASVIEQENANPSNRQSTESQPGTAPQVHELTPQSNPGEFYDKEMDLHFNYPVEMKLLDGASDMEIGHRNIFGMPGDTDPEHQQAERCMRILLDASLPAEKAPQRNADIQDLWVDDSKQYKESRKAEPIRAKIFMVELLPDCVPKKLRKKEDDVLGSMALSAVSMPGIGRMPKPIWYEIGKQKIHMNSGVGRPIVNGEVAPAPVIIMSMATEWRGHLLDWVFTSNDTEIFNELTKSMVRFGDGPWNPIFAGNLGPKGAGTPMTILPK